MGAMVERLFVRRHRFLILPSYLISGPSRRGAFFLMFEAFSEIPWDFLYGAGCKSTWDNGWMA